MSPFFSAALLATPGVGLEVEDIWEVEASGGEREWLAERAGEDVVGGRGGWFWRCCGGGEGGKEGGGGFLWKRRRKGGKEGRRIEGKEGRKKERKGGSLYVF